MLPFQSDETPISYASRMSRLHTGRPLTATVRDFRIDPLDLASNKPAALSRLAEISGVAERDLRWNAAVPIGGRAYDLRGETVSAEFLSSPKIVFCPACLNEDDQEGARRVRWHWSLAAVRTCPVHQIALQHRTKSAWNDDLRSMDHVVFETGAALVDLAASSERRAASPLQDYVLARLDGECGPQWLDAQTLDQAVRATQLLGVMLEFGPSQLLPKLLPDDWDLAGRVGFAFTSRGEAGIIEALQAQIGKFSDAKGSPGTRAIFGGFYNALAHSKSMKDPGDIARITREFIWDNIAMPAGSKVFGHVLPERRLHTVASLANETGHDSRRLRNILAGEGVIPHDAAAHYPIPVEVGRNLAARVSRIVKMTELAAVLGCTRPLVVQLCHERLLTPVYYGEPGIKGKLQNGVDSHEVAALLAVLSSNSEASSDTGGLVTIAKASEKAKIPAVCVVQLVCAGLLTHVVRLDGMSGIDGLRVCPSEVKLVSRARLVGVTSSEAFSALKLNTEAGWELADRHLDEVSLEPFRIIGGTSGVTITRFLPESIEAFAARFASIARIAEMRAVGVREMKALLKEVRVKPALDWREVGMDIYRLSDVADALPS
jgi:hypothetical protein